MGEAAEVMRRDIAAFNAQDAKEIMAIFSPECEREVPGDYLRGPDQVLAWRSALWEAFPDMQLTISRVVEEGSAVAIQGSAKATHRGTFRTPGGDIPPTDRRVEFTFADDYEVRGGVIVFTRLHVDRLAILEQLGVPFAPAPSAPSST